MPSTTTNDLHSPVSNVLPPSGQPPPEVTIDEAVVEEGFVGNEQRYGPHERSGPGARRSVIVRTAPTAHLPEVAEATFGPVEELVIDTDDREQVVNTADHPWRMNASLRITAADNSIWMGTAWFIGPHTLATAGHCVFIHAPGTPRHGWVRSIQVMPGRQVTALPYGSVTSTDFRAVSGWTGADAADQQYDYAAINIPTELGETIGWYGLGVYPDGELVGAEVHVSGYPGDKPSGTQWHHSRAVTAVDSAKVYYDIDTAGGQSGSAVYRVIDDKYVGVAVHAYGGSTANNGTRIVQAVYDNLTTWKK